MGSSRGQDASLGTGLSLPQWMKGRMDNRYDFDQSSFSPPSHDDSFLCIRYAKTNEFGRNATANNKEADGYRPISQVLTDKGIEPSGSVVVGRSGTSGIDVGTSRNLGNSTITSNIKDVKTIDFSKHPLPCQPFVPASAGGQETKSSVTKNFKSSKSQGTDDGFHGEPALCGKSIVHVANRIMSKKLVNIDASTGADSTNGKLLLDKHDRDDDFGRKGSSKSLPVTPIASPISTPDTSPKSRRKNHANRYFTGAFIPDRDKYPAGWLLSSILGQSREITSNKIQEEDEDTSFDNVPSKFLSRKKSISSQNLSYLGKEDIRKIVASTSSTVNVDGSRSDDQQQSSSSSQQQQQQLQQLLQQQQGNKQTAVYTNVFQAKPSELREMNFWSPTSM